MGFQKIQSKKFLTQILGITKGDNKIVAVKKIPLGSHEGDQQELADLHNEIELYKEIPPHMNIVPYLGSKKDENYLNIIMEYVEGGS